ncbi:hypothetical protein NDU88_003408 [Pleurodeles waltl]|uniref:Uncharacterized protein n=1 Tax=Pleurodeles waltl TaxID=8319 RepID=A0AAV7W3F5_PLEWA|nr:hypothetical protein NDU88_003408 [Pleurodeles waltl]
MAARGQREEDGWETEQRAALPWGRSKTWDLWKAYRERVSNPYVLKSRIESMDDSCSSFVNVVFNCSDKESAFKLECVELEEVVWGVGRLDFSIEILVIAS